MRRLAVVLGIAGSLAALVATPVTLARFTASSSSTATLSTASLVPPTSLTGIGGATAGLSWTASTSTVAAGYQVLRSATSGSGYTQVGTVAPVSATSTTDSPAAGTWYYVLRTYAGTWTSATSSEVAVVVGSTVSTGLKGCASNAADTGGDGNGYEGTPGNGCAADGALAVDANSGTDTTLSCTGAGKDRHRFWGYAFGLPGAVTSVNGITLRLDAGMSNNGGTSILCAELSWDGGGTWTAPKQVTLSGTSVATYTLGGASDAWGHRWTPTELATANFRVRLTDVTSQSNKDFRLDFAGVGVAYTP